MSMDIVYEISMIPVEATRGRLPSDGRPGVKLLLLSPRGEWPAPASRPLDFFTPHFVTFLFLGR